VPPERHRAQRHPFVASIELTDLQSEIHMKEQTSDLSLFGCHVNASKPLPAGTKVRIRITHRGQIFGAFGRVANVQPNVGMGISFTNIERNDELTLEKWITEQREQ
jgi:PilZ domain-containing protein